MKKLICILCLVIGSSNPGHSQVAEISIDTGNLKVANYLKASDFYLTHYLYIDLFLRENLYHEATTAEVAAILSALKRYVSVDNKLDIRVTQPGKEDYLIRFAIMQPAKNTEMLIAFTNWNVKNRRFGRSINLEDDPYVRWYFLNGDKATYRKDMAAQQNYAGLDSLELANAFLFDEVEENDLKVQDLLTGVLQNKNLDYQDKIMAHLILLKYYLLMQEGDKVEAQASHISYLFTEAEASLDLRALKMAYEATKIQVELMN